MYGLTQQVKVAQEGHKQFYNLERNRRQTTQPLLDATNKCRLPRQDTNDFITCKIIDPQSGPTRSTLPVQRPCGRNSLSRRLLAPRPVFRVARRGGLRIDPIVPHRAQHDLLQLVSDSLCVDPRVPIRRDRPSWLQLAMHITDVERELRI